MWLYHDYQALPSTPPLSAAFGEKWYNEKFLPWFGPLALISLIYTIIVLFALQGHQVHVTTRYM